MADVPRADLTAYRGDTNTYDITIDPPDAAVGATDLRMAVKRSHADADAAAVWVGTLGSGVSWVVQASGTAKAVIPAAQFDGLPARSYVYDVQMKLSDNTFSTVVQGRLRLQADVARTRP